MVNRLSRYKHLATLCPPQATNEVEDGDAAGNTNLICVQAQLRAHGVHERHVTTLENEMLVGVCASPTTVEETNTSKLKILEKMMSYRTESLRRREDLLEELSKINGLSSPPNTDDEDVEFVDVDGGNDENVVVAGGSNNPPHAISQAPAPPVEIPNCVIDLDQILPGQKVIRLPCMCIFHYDCIMPYLVSTRNPRCPIDRTVVPRQDIRNLPSYTYSNHH